MTKEEKRIACDEAVLKTIDIQQSLIARMASTSATTKNWCVTIVAAVAVAAIEKANPNLFWVSVFATFIFLVLDCYYLALERRFRRAHIEFAKKVRTAANCDDDLFLVGDSALKFVDTLSAVLSRSIWPFYLLVLLGCFAGLWFVEKG